MQDIEMMTSAKVFLISDIGSHPVKMKIDAELEEGNYYLLMR